MVFVRKKKIKGKEYYYLVHSIRAGSKVKKTEKYIGSKKPTREQIKGFEASFPAAKPAPDKRHELKSLKAEVNKELRKKWPAKKRGFDVHTVQETLTKALKNRPPAPKAAKEHIRTGIPGFDRLFKRGIPQGATVLIAGGAGSGKTIFCLQTLANHAAQGKKCYYMSFEESEERLIGHMRDFGWEPDKLIKAGNLVIERYSPFHVSRTVEAMLAKEKGELLIDVDPVVLPDGFTPDFIALDSLTAVGSVFVDKEDSYRIYIEQLFRFFESLGCTSFLITETEQVPEIFSTAGVEEFLADGVFVLYNLKREGVRENAIEVLKMRGEEHQKRMVAMQISDKGIIVYPEQEVFGGTG